MNSPVTFILMLEGGWGEVLGIRIEGIRIQQSDTKLPQRKTFTLHYGVAYTQR